MKTPERNVIKFEDLLTGDYISAERKQRDWMKGPDWRQGTITQKSGNGILLNTGKILFDEDGWTFVLLERPNDNNPDATTARFDRGGPRYTVEG